MTTGKNPFSLKFTFLYVLDENGAPVEAGDIEQFGEFFENFDNRRVAEDIVGNRTISTVFLGFNHCHIPDGPPVLWETAIFDGDDADIYDRYTSREEAEAGHKRCVEEVKASAS